MMLFTGPATKLADIDLPAIGALIGVGEDEVHAILDTEAAGSGFDSLRRPKMLFEPHIFYRLLKARDEATGSKLLERAVDMGLAYRQWRPGAYPKDSYPRLLVAMKISEEIALRSASWGLGQVMGFNHSMCGYMTAKQMVEAFKTGEREQLAAMVRFIVASGLDDELRAHDWAGFARGYNGPGFAQNGYDKKLASSFQKWQKIKDTPYPPQTNK